ncbi:hypothetical protein [Dechloromonas sp. A34]|uniref:hypothetical protein n=1 Tax=Dechloromonas sp. A34 TaxID=447588 RepID=UPI00224927C2|nr:hypothetical protein [Dechloromonas sp. A34]
MDDSIFSLNEQIIGKDLERLKRYNNSFVNVRDTLAPTQIMDVCADFGFATAAVLKEDGKRTGENVAGIRVAQLDFDNTWTVEEATEHPLYQDYAIGLYSTPSHGKVQDDLPDSKAVIMSDAQAAAIRTRVGQAMVRFRLVFVLSEQLPAVRVPAFYAGLFAEFPMADVSCRDRARMFFGSPNAVVRIDNPFARRMDKERVDALVVVGQASSSLPACKPVKKPAAQAVDDSSPSEMPNGQPERFNKNLIVILANGEVTTCKDLRKRMKSGYENRLACFSPFRQENRPSAFVQRDAMGRLYFNDTTARKSYAYA